MVSAVLLAILVSKMDFEGALPRQRHLSTLAWFAAALILALLGIVLGLALATSARCLWRARIPLRTLTNMYFAGQFMGNVLPSTIGGDVLRVTRLGKSIGSSETAFGSVVLERLTGFLRLIICDRVRCCPGFSEGTPWIAVVISVASLRQLVAILAVAGHLASPDGSASTRTGCASPSARCTRGEETCASTAGGGICAWNAMIYQVSTVLTVWCAARTLGVNVSFAEIVAAVVVAMAQVLPLSLAGLGVREGMLVLLPHPIGVSSGKAIGIGLLWYLTMLLVSLLGAPAFAVGGWRKRADADDQVGADQQRRRLRSRASDRRFRVT